MNGPSPAVTTALIGSICDMVVSGPVAWPDQIADLIVGKSSDTVDRRDNFRVAEIDLGLFHRRFVGFDVCSALSRRLRWQYLAPDR